MEKVERQTEELEASEAELVPELALQPPHERRSTTPRKRRVLPEHLPHEVRVVLQADAYAGFNKLYEDGSIEQAPCMIHIRRKFYDLMEAHHSPIATEATERIGRLYAIEKGDPQPISRPAS